MEELLYKTSFWIARDYELTAYRYVELSQSLMLFSDRTFELRWINYAQNSALMEPENPSEPVPPNTNIHICVSGNVGIVNSNTLELAPSRKFIGSDEVPLDFSPFRCVVNQSVLAVDSPLQQDPRFNKLTLSKAK